MILTLDLVIPKAGNYAHIGMKTISTNVLNSYSKAITYDSNPTFG